MVAKDVASSKTGESEKFAYDNLPDNRYGTKILASKNELKNDGFVYSQRKAETNYDEFNRIAQNKRANKTINKGILKNSSINCGTNLDSVAVAATNDSKTNVHKSKFVSFSNPDETASSPLASSIYYGVKSYLHHFYEPINGDTRTNGENILEDDFEFVIEPGRRKNGCLFGISMCFGTALLFGGIILILYGNSMKPEDAIVNVERNLQISDQNTTEFDENLETYRLGGLITFCVGGIVIILTLLISAYEREFKRFAADKGANCNHTSYSAPLIDPNLTPWIRYAADDNRVVDNRIPLSREIKAVQTTNITS